MLDDTGREERLQKLQAMHDEAHRQGVREWQAQTKNILSTLEDKQGLQAARDKATAKREAARVRNQGATAFHDQAQRQGLREWQAQARNILRTLEDGQGLQAARDKAMVKREAARVRNQGVTAFHDEHSQETQRQRRQVQINKRRARKVKRSEQDLRELDTVLAHEDTNIQRLQTALAASMAGNTVATDLGTLLQQNATEGHLYPAKAGNRELSTIDSHAATQTEDARLQGQTEKCQRKVS